MPHQRNSRIAMRVSTVIFGKVDTGSIPVSWGPLNSQEESGGFIRSLCPFPSHPCSLLRNTSYPPLGSPGFLIQETPVLRIPPGASVQLPRKPQPFPWQLMGSVHQREAPRHRRSSITLHYHRHRRCLVLLQLLQPLQQCFQASSPQHRSKELTPSPNIWGNGKG